MSYKITVVGSTYMLLYRIYGRQDVIIRNVEVNEDITGLCSEKL